MLHARWHGETFGLAVGEFAVLGKPVITYGGSRERAHLEMLGSHSRTYHNDDDLHKILKDFQPSSIPATEYEQYAEPSIVMRRFQAQFLDTVP